MTFWIILSFLCLGLGISLLVYGFKDCHDVGAVIGFILLIAAICMFIISIGVYCEYISFAKEIEIQREFISQMPVNDNSILISLDSVIEINAQLAKFQASKLTYRTFSVIPMSVFDIQPIQIGN